MAGGYFPCTVIPSVITRSARTFLNSTQRVVNSFTHDWSQNVLHNLLWNIALSNISYNHISSFNENWASLKHQNYTFLFCSVYYLCMQKILSDMIIIQNKYYGQFIVYEHYIKRLRCYILNMMYRLLHRPLLATIRTLELSINEDPSESYTLNVR